MVKKTFNRGLETKVSMNYSTIKIDFESLIQVMLDELERQYPNEVMSALQGTKVLLRENIKQNPKEWFTALGFGILAIDGQESGSQSYQEYAINGV